VFLRCASYALGDPINNAVIISGFFVHQALYLGWPVGEQAILYNYWQTYVAINTVTKAVTTLNIIPRTQGVGPSIIPQANVLSSAYLCYIYSCPLQKLSYYFEVGGEVIVKIFTTNVLRQLTIMNITLMDSFNNVLESEVFTSHHPLSLSSWDVASFTILNQLVRKILIIANAAGPTPQSTFQTESLILAERLQRHSTQSNNQAEWLQRHAKFIYLDDAANSTAAIELDIVVVSNGTFATSNNGTPTGSTFSSTGKNSAYSASGPFSLLFGVLLAAGFIVRRNQ